MLVLKLFSHDRQLKRVAHDRPMFWAASGHRNVWGAEAMNQFTVMLISKSIGRTAFKPLMNKECTCKRCQVCAIHFFDILKFRYFISTVNLLDPKDFTIQWKIGYMLFCWAGFKLSWTEGSNLFKECFWSLALWTDGNSKGGNCFPSLSAIAQVYDLGQMTCSHISCFHLLFSKHLRRHLFYMRQWFW